MYFDIINFLQRTDIYAKINSKSFLLFFISQISIILITVLSLKEFKKISIGGIILLVLGILSMFFLFFHIISLDEILDDYKYGYSYTPMLKLAWYSHIFLSIFFLYSLIYFIYLRITLDRISSINSASGNQTFVALNILGIVCSIIGMLLIVFHFAMFHHMQMEINLQRNFNFVALIPYFFVFFPYFLVWGAWKLQHYDNDSSERDDERQYLVTHRSAMVALAITLPLMTGIIVFFVLKMPAEVKNNPFAGTLIFLGMLLFLILMLFVFSIAGIYFSKKSINP
ncbi:MAG: hypothetical protein ACM3O8_00825 [Methylococcaceae bacterium]